MKKLRIAHSVWTKPMLGRRWNIDGQLANNLWLFANSVANVKKFGHEIVLHTDKLGKELYGWLPYDEIHLTLDNHNVHERFWASGKILAQEAEPLHSVHIDGDVFLQKQEVWDLIADQKSDLIVQMIERDNTVASANSCYGINLNLVLSALNLNVPEGFNRYQNSALNCGLVKFNNQKLKDRYIAGYKKMLEICSNEPHFIKRIAGDNNLCPDLVMEQWWLKSVACYYGYKVKTVLPEWDENFQSESKRIGYCHVVGAEKYEKISLVKDGLWRINPELYKKVEKIIEKL